MILGHLPVFSIVLQIQIYIYGLYSSINARTSNSGKRWIQVSDFSCVFLLSSLCASMSNLFFLSIGYQHRSVNREQTKIYWWCIERDSCNGTITSNFNVQNAIILQCGKLHTHESSMLKIEVQEVIRAMKRRAVDNSNAPLVSIF